MHLSLEAERSRQQQKSPINQNRPRRAALASWVELLSYQAGGGHYYEDVGCILAPGLVPGNKAKALEKSHRLTTARSMIWQHCVRKITQCCPSP
jgi:hypothetical protein